MNGFLILDKPEGLTSAQCVYKLRSKLGIKRIGHCGTLDPLATGLLPICIGEATKFSNFASEQDKVYEVGIKFGIETDTGDFTGNIVSKSNFIGFKEDFSQFLTDLEGIQNQTPPMYSAIKINGNPLYYWARKGVYLYRIPRRVDIQKIELIEKSINTAILRVTCSKGTYIRSLIEKLGRNLNSFATVISLRRLEVGKMHLNHKSCSFEDSYQSLIDKVLPCDAMLSDLVKVKIKKEDVKKVRNGLSIDYNALVKNKGLVRIYTEKEIFLGIGEVSDNKLQPKRLISTN
ncbi:tRNA pseudouridine(55) synthase TruB [SAR86 cluster bacterium]|nr:tRNA pseudouridine(55) synthase TruB [SAR86 cluster bacterium]